MVLARLAAADPAQVRWPLRRHERHVARQQLERAADCWAYNGDWVFENDTLAVLQAVQLPPSWTAGRQYCPWRPTSERTLELGYRWVPSQACGATAGAPYLRNVDLVRAMLDKLRCTKLLIVGDSMNSQLWHALQGYMATFSAEHPPGKAMAATLVQNDYLNLNTVDARLYESASNSHVFEPWAPLFTNTSTSLGGPTSSGPPVHQRDRAAFDAVVLNRGRHFQHNNKTLPAIADAVRYVRRHAHNALILVRSTSLDHYKLNCSAMVNRAPLSAIEAAQHFHNSVFQSQSRDVAAMVRNTFPLHAPVIYWDVTNATARRADSHFVEIHRRAPPTHADGAGTVHRESKFTMDCTHYCLPGPIDMWVELLGNVLLRAQALGLLRPCFPGVKVYM